MQEKLPFLSAAEFTPRVTVSGKLRLRYSASDSLQLRKKRSFTAAKSFSELSNTAISVPLNGILAHKCSILLSFWGFDRGGRYALQRPNQATCRQGDWLGSRCLKTTKWFA